MISVKDSDTVMISDFNASKEDSRTDRYPRRADDQEYSYQDTFNDTDDYSNKDDVSYQTDEESDQREKPTVQAVYTNSVSQDLNYCVASRSISNSTTSSVRSKALSFHSSSKSIRRAVNEALKKKNYEASWVPSSDEDV